MERKNNEAGVCATPIEGQAGSGSEIDLYDELTAFSELTPDEQLRLLARPGESSTENRTAPSEKSGELASTNDIETQATAESATGEATGPADVPTAEASSESVSNQEGSAATPSEGRADVFVRPSGPLGSLTKGVVFTGSLSRGVCLACGAESGTDDLFCITCGVFIDEIS